MATAPLTTGARGGTLRITIISIAVACFCGPAKGGDAATPSLEYQVKASYLYNFLQFVTWPEETFSSDKDSIVIALYGEDKFGSALDSLANVRVKGRAIKVKKCAGIEDVVPSHVLFVVSSTATPAAAVLSEIDTHGLLTVGEERDFARNGGVINFLLDDGRVRFEVNRSSADQSGLSLSSQLLKLAVKVYKTHDRTQR